MSGYQDGTPGMTRPSLRARIIRAGMPIVMRRAIPTDPTVEVVRRRVKLLGRLVPPTPRGTTTTTVKVGDVTADRIVTPASRPDRHIIHLHGGSYITGWPGLFRDFTWRLATVCRAVVWCLDYRLAPEHPFPAALDDAVAAYRFLLGQGIEPRHITLLGDSAGGGLVFATLLRLRDEGVPLAAASVAISPWTDLALTGESLNAGTDPLIPVALAPRVVELCLAGADPRNPYASPLYGDLRDLPPTLILVGGDDALRDDAVRMAANMRTAGCTAELEVWPHMWHVWPMLARILPEAKAALARIGSFMHDRW